MTIIDHSIGFVVEQIMLTSFEVANGHEYRDPPICWFVGLVSSKYFFIKIQPTQPISDHLKYPTVDCP